MLAGFFCRQAKPCFLLVDAARSPGILPLLVESGATYACLYSGVAAQDLAYYAPYLVEVASGSPFLEKFLQEGWDHAWGYVVVSDAPLEALRTHLRKFLKVTLDDGESVYFRFYDPRVIRIFLPTCSAEQATEFMKPIDTLFCASNTAGNVLAFRMHGGKLASRELPIPMLAQAAAQA